MVNLGGLRQISRGAADRPECQTACVRPIATCELRVDCDCGEELVGSAHAPDMAVAATQDESRPPGWAG